LSLPRTGKVDLVKQIQLKERISRNPIRVNFPPENESEILETFANLIFAQNFAGASSGCYKVSLTFLRGKILLRIRNPILKKYIFGSDSTSK
jgi:hypothetical protein